jgi:hypothetical protein
METPRAWPRIVGWAAAACLGSAVAWLASRSVHTGYAQSFDSMLYARSLWGLAHGAASNPVADGVHALAIHSHAGLLFLIPFAWAWPAVDVLTVAQGVAFAAAIGVTVAAVVRELEGRFAPWIAAAGALVMALLCSLGAPLVLNPFLFDLRPDVYAIPLMAWALIRADRTQTLDRWAMVAIVAAMLCREDMAWVALAAAVAMRGPKRTRWALGVGSLVYWAAYWWGVRGLLGGATATGRAETSFEVLFMETFRLSQVQGKAVILAAALFGMGGFVLRGGRLLWVALPGLALTLAQHRMQNDVIRFHYSMFLAPALLAAAVAGVRALAAKPTRRALLAHGLGGGALTIAAFVLGSAAPGGGRFAAAHFAWPGSPSTVLDVERLPAAHEVLRSLPADAAVLTHFAFGAPLANRRTVRNSAQLGWNAADDGWPKDTDLVVLIPGSWASDGASLVQRGAWLWDAVPGALAVLGDTPPPRPPVHLMRVQHACAAPLGRWPSEGLLLCDAGRFSDGRFAVVLLRDAAWRDPAPHSGNRPLRVFARRGAAASALVALNGLLEPSALVPGRAMRVLGAFPHGEGPLSIELVGRANRTLETIDAAGLRGTAIEINARQ